MKRKNVNNSFIFRMINSIKKKYLFNKKQFFIGAGSIAIILIVLSFGIFNTISRLGFNLAVSDNDLIPDVTWYTKLTNNDDTDDINYDVWDGSVSESLSGSGIESDPYLVTNGADLEYLNTLIASYTGTSNLYIKIANNIDLDNIEFNPINVTNNSHVVIDGDFKIIKGLNSTVSNVNGYNFIGLFGSVANVTIKNIVLDSVNITYSTPWLTYVGGLVGYAGNNTKIYNCGVLSGNINVTKNSTDRSYVGGLVGYLNNKSALVNSYSYMNITSNGTNNTTSYFGGLVGYRNGTNSALDFNNPIVYLLNYYGEMKIASYADYQFVYAGKKIEASQTPTYCYYLWRGDKHDTNTAMSNTYAILKSHQDISSSGHLAHLNNYRYMANYYLGFDTTPRASESSGYSEIANWDINNNIAVYPINKKHTQIVHQEYMNFTSSESEAISSYGAGNYLKVNFTNSSNNNSMVTYYIKITDKDEKNNDYVNHKIILPFNSVSTNFTYGTNGKDLMGYDVLIGGWKLTRVNYNGKVLTEAVSGSNINFNYVLRTGEKGASKDIGTVYSQGGYYLVPEGVREVTFSTQWTHVIYIKDAHYEEVFKTSYENDTAASNKYGSTSNGTEDGKSPATAFTSLEKAYNQAANVAGGYNIYEFAFALAGNFHYSTFDTSWYSYAGEGANRFESFWPNGWLKNEMTIMSLDQDNDLEPDYTFYTRTMEDMSILGFRLDFVNFLAIPRVGMIDSKLNNIKIEAGTKFEISETAVTDEINFKVSGVGEFKINGGNVNIYATEEAEKASKRLSHIYFGGKAYARVVNFGSASTESGEVIKSKAPVFVVAGGRIETLSSTYLSTIVDIKNDVYFYIDGGYIDRFYATYNSSLDRSATITANGTYFNYYYAGGHTSSSNIAMGVTSTITNSIIGELYGGPEYGSIEGKSVLNVYGSTVNKLFGSGYGGTQTTEVGLSYYTKSEASNDSGYCTNKNYSNQFTISSSCGALDTNRTGTSKSYCFGRTDKKYGIETGFDSSIYSKNGCVFKSFDSLYSDLSTASVDYVTVNFVNSTLNSELYGGGNKGIVNNSVEVNISNSTVNGDVYGGGLSNETETLEVYENTTGYTYPSFISYSVDSHGSYPQKQTYTWVGDKKLFSGNKVVDTTKKIIYSDNVNKLGMVYGSIYLNIFDSKVKGNVYGGGNLSPVNGDIHVNLYGKNDITGTVYGGGKKAKVVGTTDVRLMGGTYEEVFAGGDEGIIEGQSSITASNDTEANNLYGGGNQSSTTTTKVYLVDGKFGNVYGGAKNDGFVKDSNIYTGLLPISTPAFEPTYPEFNYPDYEDDGSDDEPIGTPSTDTNGYPYLPDVDTCSNRAITFSYIYDRSGKWNNFTFTLYNNTSVKFNSYEVQMELVNANGFQQSTGRKTSYNTSTKVLTIDSHSEWWSGYDRSIEAGKSEVVTQSASDGSDAFRLNPVDSNKDVSIVWVKVKAQGADGKVYTYEDCLDAPVIITPGSGTGSGGEDLPVIETTEDLRFKFTRPLADNKVGIVEADTIYGGNNLGGKVDTTHVNIFDSNVTAHNIYGGGNKVETDSTFVDITTGIVGNVFGGGNEGVVNKNTEVSVLNAKATGNIYGGGNGSSATVIGNTHVYVGGDKTNIDGSVFGGGNAAATGTPEKNSSSSTVDIAGGYIKGNVYGGANTSVINGTVDLNIGIAKDKYAAPITIIGTVFGGGEANAEGSPIYDYKFISVTVGIDIDIISYEKSPIRLSGSIFGSGNASSTSGYSYLDIVNLGTKDDVDTLVSIQRVGTCNIYNSYIEVSGTNDSANYYTSYIYSLNRIDDLNLIDNTYLYLQNSTNLVQNFNSYALRDGKKVIATVDIDEDGKVTKNVDNRLYLYANKSVNLMNVEKLDDAETFGEVNGMTFLGLYETNGETISEGFYNTEYKTGDKVTNSEFYQFASGSYVMGIHKIDHDIKVDGFYTNVVDDDLNLTIDYINPTPNNAKYYRWLVGTPSANFEIKLIASKFATLGTGSVELENFNYANSYFEMANFNDKGFDASADLYDPDSIPRVAKSDEDALTKFGLKMTSNNVSWLTDGKSYFIANDDEVSYNGTTKYQKDSSEEMASFDFYFVHSKNINMTKDLGYVTICMLGYVPVDEVTYEVTRIYFTVYLSTKYYETNNYEGAMTSGKKDELFVSTLTNITADSQLSAYYSLYVEAPKTIYGADYHRVLTSTYKLPVNTRITMIDTTIVDDPVYYYYIVTAENYDNVQTQLSSNASGITDTFYIYPLSDFIRMGSISGDNKYDNDYYNKRYYDPSIKTAQEEFIFTVDYSQANITENIHNAELLLELKDEDDYTIYDSLGASHVNLVYSAFVNEHASIDVELESNKEVVYAGNEFNINAKLEFVQPYANYQLISDTAYTQSKMGLKLSLYDSNGNKVTGTALIGTLFYVNGNAYSANLDGYIRLNVSDFVADADVVITVDLTSSNLATDTYRIVADAFGSPDGLYFGLTAAGSAEMTIDIINELYGINVHTPDDSVIIDSKTGFTTGKTNEVKYTVEYVSQFSNPNLRVKLVRRDYSSVYSTTYEDVDLADYVSTELTKSNDNEYVVSLEPEDINTFVVNYKDNLMTGTYKIVFELYDGDNYIDSDYDFLFIK